MDEKPEQKQGLIPKIPLDVGLHESGATALAERILASPEDIKTISIKDLATSARFRNRLSRASCGRFRFRVSSSSRLLIAEVLSQGGARAPAAFERHVLRGHHRERQCGLRAVDGVSALFAHGVRHDGGLSESEVLKAVSAYEKADVIAFYAMGASLLCVENALLRFMRVGKKCLFFRDLGIARFRSRRSAWTRRLRNFELGRTISTVDSLEHAKMQGATTICITSFSGLADCTPQRHQAVHADGDGRRRFGGL